MAVLAYLKSFRYQHGQWPTRTSACKEETIYQGPNATHFLRKKIEVWMFFSNSKEESTTIGEYQQRIAIIGFNTLRLIQLSHIN